MKIFIASDHAGFKLKEDLKQIVANQGFEVKDFGAFSNAENDDYPDFIKPLAGELSTLITSGELDIKGIIIGGSGQGEAICANRFKGIRAVVFNGQYAPRDGREVPDEIVISREHNDANILSLGARFIDLEEASEAVLKWLRTSFNNEERHLRRINKIDGTN